MEIDENFNNVIIKGIIRDIQTLRKNNGLRGALILTYCAIDTLAYLSVPLKEKEVVKKDFLKWVKDYMPQYDPNDLYSARCALVHQYGSESNLSRRGQARKVGYVYQKYHKHLYGKTGKTKDMVLFDVDILIDDFINGFRNWIKEILKNKRLKNRVEKHLPELICDIKDKK